MSIKRYDKRYNDVCIGEYKDGLWVRYEDYKAEVERLQNQLDHISFESYTLTISQANKRLHSKVEDLQAEVERLRKVFMHCIENGVMTQDAYEIYDELKAKAEGGEVMSNCHQSHRN